MEGVDRIKRNCKITIIELNEYISINQPRIRDERKQYSNSTLRVIGFPGILVLVRIN